MKFLPALRTSVLLSVLFVAVYCGTNWLTSLRHDVGSMVFGWERHIPFLPWFIVPYLSIDLFFVAAPFLCGDARELRTLAGRVTLAVILAGICFLVYPLKFTFERPTTDGWLGVVFDSFRQMDRPFNQLPSLHITLMLILAATYARHTHGLTRAALMSWFILIGLSTVFTWQHHVVDIAGGILLGALCFHIVPGTPVTERSTPNRRIGACYGAGALALLAPVPFLPPWGIFLVWPAGALAITSLACFRGDAGLFRKQHGIIPAASRLWMAPVLLGQHLSLACYRRQCNPWDDITPGLRIGGVLDRPHALTAIRTGVIAVLDLTAEFSETPVFLGLPYRNIRVLDLTAPTPQQFAGAIAFIDRHVAEGTVYVHCKIGYSRSAAVAIAWLVHSGRSASVRQAVETLRAARPAVVIRPEIIPAVEAYLAIRGRENPPLPAARNHS